MKESMECAKTVAYSLIEEQKEECGFHIHVPEGATPKDGPSAGGAITIAIWSILTDTKINPQIAMTGEIDLLGNIKAIGGLREKLSGAKRSKVKIAIIPEENRETYEKLVCGTENVEPFQIEDDNFKVVIVKHITEAIEVVKKN